MSEKYTIEDILLYAQDLLVKDSYPYPEKQPLHMENPFYKQSFEEKDSLFFKSDNGVYVELNPYRGGLYINGSCLYGQREDFRFGLSTIGDYEIFDSIYKYKPYNISIIKGDLQQISRDEVPLNYILDRRENKSILIKPDFRGLTLDDLPDLISICDRTQYILGHHPGERRNSIDITTADNHNISVNFTIDYFKDAVFGRKELYLDGQCLYGDIPASHLDDVVLYGEFTNFDQALSFLKENISNEPFKEVSLTNRELQYGYKGVLLSEVEAKKDFVDSSEIFPDVMSKLEAKRNLNILNGILSPENHLTFMHTPNPLNNQLDKEGKYSLDSFSALEQEQIKTAYSKMLGLDKDPDPGENGLF